MAAPAAGTAQPGGVLTLCYFQLYAKGPPAALALNHAGVAWQGRFPEAWKEEKPLTPWGELPTLEIPGVGVIGHEMAILNYIGSLSPAVGGATTAEYVNSMQLMAQAEDIYARLTRMQDTIFAKNKVPREELQALWNSNDATTHNRSYGIDVFLRKLEAFHDSCGTAAKGRFTSSGVSVGECKLFGTLLMLKLIKGDILGPYTALTQFYERFAAEPKTVDILENGGNFPEPFKQYFIAGEEQQPNQ